jgi:hypothetical protein
MTSLEQRRGLAATNQIWAWFTGIQNCRGWGGIKTSRIKPSVRLGLQRTDGCAEFQCGDMGC